jgi:hypothetical protein
VSQSAKASRSQHITSRGPLVLVESKPVSAVEHFVEAMGQELGLGTGSSDRRTRRQLLRLTQWATGEGIALDRERILDPDTVERFVTEGLAGERSAATYRAVLRRVGPRLTKSAPWEPRPRPSPVGSSPRPTATTRCSP